MTKTEARHIQSMLFPYATPYQVTRYKHGDLIGKNHVFRFKRKGNAALYTVAERLSGRDLRVVRHKTRGEYCFDVSMIIEEEE